MRSIELHGFKFRIRGRGPAHNKSFVIRRRQALRMFLVWQDASRQINGLLELFHAWSPFAWRIQLSKKADTRFRNKQVDGRQEPDCCDDCSHQDQQENNNSRPDPDFPTT